MGQTGFEGRRLLGVAETARYVGYAPRTLYNMSGPKSKVPFPVKPVRRNGKPYWDIRDLDSWIDRLKAEGGS